MCAILSLGLLSPDVWRQQKESAGPHAPHSDWLGLPRLMITPVVTGEAPSVVYAFGGASRRGATTHVDFLNPGRAAAGSWRTCGVQHGTYGG